MKNTTLLRYPFYGLLMGMIYYLFLILHECGHILVGKLIGLELLNFEIVFVYGIPGVKLQYSSYPLALLYSGILVELIFLCLSFCLSKKIQRFILPTILFKIWFYLLIDLSILQYADWAQLFQASFQYGIFFVSLMSLISIIGVVQYKCRKS